jgi:uncharacterized protein (DUF736 family)
VQSAARRLKTAAWGSFDEPSGKMAMAQIGTFTRGDDSTFTGTICTLNINVKATIKPVARDSERSRDYRVTANGVELGAGWKNAAKYPGAECVAVKLDDPSFTPQSMRPRLRATMASTSSHGRADPTAPPHCERGGAASQPRISS